jgi:hypothetical protein
MTVASVLSLLPGALLRAQDERYRTRPRDFARYEAPPGQPLAARASDTGIKVHGYTADRVVTYAADAAGLDGGELVVGTEYGRVDIADSDDGQVRLQVRWDALGGPTGPARPPGAPSRRPTSGPT